MEKLEFVLYDLFKRPLFHPSGIGLSTSTNSSLSLPLLTHTLFTFFLNRPSFQPFGGISSIGILLFIFPLLMNLVFGSFFCHPLIKTNRYIIFF